MYNIIIEKQPTAHHNTSKDTNSNEAIPNEASDPKILIPTVAAIDSITPEDFDTLNFSKYLHSKDVSRKSCKSKKYQICLPGI